MRDRSGFVRSPGARGSNSENRHVEVAEARRLGDDVSLNNLSAGDREAEYSGQLAVWRKYNSDRTVHPGSLGEADHLREGDRALRPIARAADLYRRSWTCSRLVDAHPYVGIEHCDKALEAPLCRALRNASTTFRCSEIWAPRFDSLV